MICRDNFHVTQPTDRGDKAFSSDHFLVAKFLRPQRWDIVAFRNPEEPTVLYVMRLVGLPGEEITIKDGQIWADGEMLTPPDSIRGIKYLSEIGDGYGELWGSPDHPAKLSEDEYFVLGDFSRASYDSRLWKRGAPGHNPFAVPESHLYGIVTHTYWPPGRWRTFR
jgi:signal peptidase I